MKEIDEMSFEFLENGIMERIKDINRNIKNSKLKTEPDILVANRVLIDIHEGYIFSE